jgi:hypothetical protein
LVVGQTPINPVCAALRCTLRCVAGLVYNATYALQRRCMPSLLYEIILALPHSDVDVDRLALALLAPSTTSLLADDVVDPPMP